MASNNFFEELGHYCHSLWNSWQFYRRAHRHYRSKGYPEKVYTEKAEDKTNLFEVFDDRDASLNLADREAKLLETYNLGAFRETAGKNRYLENLNQLEYLEQLFEGVLLKQIAPQSGHHESFSWLDVGAKNWSYVESLYRFIEASGIEAFELHGIELDGYRRYVDGYCRADYAQAFIQHLPNTHYWVRSLEAHWAENTSQNREKYDVISCFLPFVFVEPTLAWGLPKKYFDPATFLTQLLALLKPGGILIITNQGEDEAAEQLRLLKQVQESQPSQSFKITPVGPLPESFYPYKHTRHGVRVQS